MDALLVFAPTIGSQGHINWGRVVLLSRNYTLGMDNVVGRQGTKLLLHWMRQ